MRIIKRAVSLVTAATLIVAGTLFVPFLLFQRQFADSFVRSGVK